AAAEVENNRIKKRKLGNGVRRKPAAAIDGAEAHAPEVKDEPGPKRKTRLNKLLKGGSGGATAVSPRAKSKAAAAKKSPAKPRAVTPKRNKKLQAALRVLQDLRAKKLPGLTIPADDEMKNQSYTVYFEGARAPGKSSIGIGKEGLRFPGMPLMLASLLRGLVPDKELEPGNPWSALLHRCDEIHLIDCSGAAIARDIVQWFANSSRIHLVDYMTEYLDRSNIKKHRDLDAVEMFCGVASITRAFRKNGGKAQGYDRGRDAVLEDLGNNQGFFRAMSLVLRLKAGGLLFAGLPCNSFAFMSAGSHQRTPDNPMGANHPFVITGNLLASRSCLLFLVALIRSTCWALENPARSRVPLFPYMEKMMSLPLFRHASVFWWCPQLFLSSRGHSETHKATLGIINC
ncbi:unnamed protein product, partial [Symbiodinium sp. CCMP2456]